MFDGLAGAAAFDELNALFSPPSSPAP